jgi:hypothetical protein
VKAALGRFSLRKKIQMATKIFYNRPYHRPGIVNLTVAPATLDPSARRDDWTDLQGNPVNVTVCFRNGEAVVDDGLAAMLVKHGYARKTKPALLEAA